jgi:hypothetical protein
MVLIIAIDSILLSKEISNFDKKGSDETRSENDCTNATPTTLIEIRLSGTPTNRVGSYLEGLGESLFQSWVNQPGKHDSL